jgi:thymidylate synthase (FAD)
MQIDILDHGYVKLILTYGSDEEVIEDARQSTNKGFLGWDPTLCPTCEGVGCRDCNGTGRTKGDASLLKFLYSHKHLTPFEGSGLKFEIKAPIMVFREWHRHRTQSYNEMSARYVPLPNENYVPSIDRICLGVSNASGTNKQANSSVLVDIFTENDAMSVQKGIQENYKLAEEGYQTMLNMGVPKELARLVIPVGRYSKMRATANLRNWLAFLTLRDDPAAQWEIRQYAKAVSIIIADKFPRTHALYVEHKRS